jgi:dimethylargininase
MWTAITREVSQSLAGCELSFVPRSPIDVPLARLQHADYCAALEKLGCDVTRLPALDAYPDSVFVEDVALVFDEVAIATRPGAQSRRNEGDAVLDVLGSLRPLLQIEAPGTLDGGDVLRIGKRVFVGISARSNETGRAQLRDLLAPFGYAVEGVATRECLHLKSAVTEVAEHTLLVNNAWLMPRHSRAIESSKSISRKFTPLMQCVLATRFCTRIVSRRRWRDCARRASTSPRWMSPSCKKPKVR